MNNYLLLAACLLLGILLRRSGRGRPSRAGHSFWRRVHLAARQAVHGRSAWRAAFFNRAA
jgi:hypothetical protein